MYEICGSPLGRLPTSLAKSTRARAASTICEMAMPWEPTCMCRPRIHGFAWNIATRSWRFPACTCRPNLEPAWFVDVMAMVPSLWHGFTRIPTILLSITAVSFRRPATNRPRTLSASSLPSMFTRQPVEIARTSSLRVFAGESKHTLCGSKPSASACSTSVMLAHSAPRPRRSSSCRTPLRGQAFTAKKWKMGAGRCCVQWPTILRRLSKSKTSTHGFSSVR
mmetsp:Transcript_13388/g.49716  ORF Transcript_13388/g.49716 Transcript_13388/m.49716 type:complete len:222 (+) Transcript_13388:720-1385(+)